MQVKVIYPPHIWNIREIRLSVEAGDKAGGMMEGHTREVDDNLTVLTSRLSGIERREKILGITPRPSDTIEDRRARVHLLWYNKKLYTERLLREILDSAIGKERYTMEILQDEKMVEVRIKDASKSLMDSITRFLEEVIPLDHLFKTILQKEASLQSYLAVKTLARHKFLLYDNGREVINHGRAYLYPYAGVKSIAGIKIALHDNGKEVKGHA